MLQLTIGANFPDDALPFFAAARWTGLLFMVFMTLTFVLFANLMLAVVYKVYQDHRTQEVKGFFINRIDGLARGFQLLQESDPKEPASRVMTIEKFRMLFAYLVESPVRSHLKAENGDYIFGALDEDDSFNLDWFEFFDLSENLLMCDLCICEEDTYIVRYFNLFWLRRWLHSKRHIYFVMLILGLNVAITVYESVSDIFDQPEPPWANPVELTFAAFYMVDVLLKLSVISFRSYWATSGSRFDFLTSIILFVASCLSSCGVIQRRLVRYLNIVRMLKLVMLLDKIPQFKFLFYCIMNIFLVCKEIMVLLCLVWIVFGVVGVQAYGGSMYHANPELADSDYLHDDLLVLNFNDVPMATASLFAMLIMSYSPAHADALGRLSPWYPLGAIYCLAYYFICVVIVFNILAAFTIDVFMALEDDVEHDDAAHDVQQIERMKNLARKEGLVAHAHKSPELLKHKITIALFEDAWKEIEERKKKWEVTQVAHELQNLRNSCDSSTAGLPDPSQDPSRRPAVRGRKISVNG
jgi:hypothetical protein